MLLRSVARKMCGREAMPPKPRARMGRKIISRRKFYHAPGKEEEAICLTAAVGQSSRKNQTLAVRGAVENASGGRQ